MKHGHFCITGTKNKGKTSCLEEIMIKFESINNKHIILSVSNCKDWLYLTPKEVRDLMRELQNALFAWSSLTKRRIGEPECR